MQLELIELFFAANGTGWLQITWPAGQIDPWWPDQLKLQVSTLVKGLIEALDSHNTSASAGMGPARWSAACSARTTRAPGRCRSRSSPTHRRCCPASRSSACVCGRSSTATWRNFSTAEISPPEPTALDRWTEGLDDAGQNAAIEALGTSADELGDLGLDAGNDDERTREFARSAYAAFTALPVTTLLFLWQALGVVDFLAFASSVKSGIVIDDGAGGRGPLARGWVYVREVGSAKVTVYLTDAAGQLRCTEGDVRDAPWDYTHPFTPKAGAELGDRLLARCAPPPRAPPHRPRVRPVAHDDHGPRRRAGSAHAPRRPHRGHAAQGAGALAAAVARLRAGRGPVPDRRPCPDDRIQPNQEKAAPAIAANSAAAPRLRGLVVQGSVDAAATSVEIELAASDGTSDQLRQSLQANAPQVQRAAATLGAPTGPTRSFDATIVLDPATIPQRLGDVQIVVVRHGLDGTRFEAVSELLTGVQIALVDDPAPTQRGPFLGAADEVVVVDFKGASPQASAASLAGKARVRRMVEYKIDIIARASTTPRCPPIRTRIRAIPKPRMPRWMAEAQLAGADRPALKDLMRRRAFRDSRPAGGEPAPLQKLALDLAWKLDLAWDGPDANAGIFRHGSDQPAQPASQLQGIDRGLAVGASCCSTPTAISSTRRERRSPSGPAARSRVRWPDEKRPPFVEADRRRPQVLDREGAASMGTQRRRARHPAW